MTDLPPDSVLMRILDGVNPMSAMRQWRRLGIEEVAKEAGIGADLLREMEDGRPGTPDEIGAVAAALNVKPGYLINHQDDSYEIGADEIPW